MAIFVMLIIIILNIALLFIVMRVGTQGEHYSEMSADQSTAVVALHDRLGLPRPEPKGIAVVQEHAEDVVNTIAPDEDVPPTDVEKTKDITEDKDAVAKMADGDDSADVADELSVSGEEVKAELSEIAENVDEAVTDNDNTDSSDDDD